MLQLTALTINTLLLWVAVVVLHQSKKKLSIIPLYGLIAVLTILTHVLSSFGLGVESFGLYFFVASTAYFTPLLLAIVILYLFEGVHAARKALEIVILSSLVLIAAIMLGTVQDSKHIFIESSLKTYTTYFWSILAMVIDIIVVAVGWESINKIKKIPHFISVTILLFGVFCIDTVIFVTGVFWGNDQYLNMLKANVLVRLILAILMGAFSTWYLRTQKFSETHRLKPENLFSILDFKSEDERQVWDLRNEIVNKEKLQKELTESRDLYQLVIDSIDAGVWEWSIKTGDIKWSPKAYEILGFADQAPKITYDDFFSLMHPDDIERTKTLLAEHFENGATYRVEYRIKNRIGEYHWIEGAGKSQVNEKGKPIKMIGSLIDINDKKNYESELQEKIKNLSDLNKMMVNRELKMIELKKRIEELESVKKQPPSVQN